MNSKMQRLAVLFALTALAVPLLQASGHGYLEEAQARLGTLEEKFVGLAEAVPQGEYTYRPGEGVRSVSEVFMHVAGANYFVARALGTMPPEDLNLRGLEKSTTDQQEVVSRMKMAFAHLKGAFGKFGAGDADNAVKLFGRDMTTRGALLFALEHLSEHLGQSIAYARVRGVTPPWSE